MNYWPACWKLKETRPHWAKKKVLFHHDNVPAQLSEVVAFKLNELRYELLPHQPIFTRFGSLRLLLVPYHEEVARGKFFFLKRGRHPWDRGVFWIATNQNKPTSLLNGTKGEEEEVIFFQSSFLYVTKNQYVILWSTVTSHAIHMWLAETTIKCWLSTVNLQKKRCSCKSHPQL